ncbi:MAG: alpha-amylase family glycosyl hydrolase [Verrucomicrobiales bacterium]
MKPVLCATSVLLLAMSSLCPAGETSRPVIYQLMVRTFGNANDTRKPGGTIAENGCGKFNDINDAAVTSLKKFGVTHVWLTGVMEQASATEHPGRPGDDPDILKGLAGSPYAIKDYFDVCPDYAVNPTERLKEFRALVERAHRYRLKVLVDFVPNHVSRAYQSDVKPDLSFGANDKKDVFFDSGNNFFYLGAEQPGGGPPLRLPTAGRPGCDGLFDGEKNFGRVTGNNVITWQPNDGDWYETVKLNYGHDFTRGRDTSHLPGPEAAPETVPDTWRKMDQILAYWQALGIDGFRVDMAHMVPMEFWAWSIQRARGRSKDVFFVAEAYDNDPAKLTDGNVLEALLENGFDSVYDDATYDLVHEIFTGPKWANDIEALCQDAAPLFHRSLRYAENHDEVRLANPGQWGGHGAKVGRPVTALLLGLGRGPVMLYHGQETGEPATGAEGYAGDDGRTTIFDYWSLPTLQGWGNGGKFDGTKLVPDAAALRTWYGKLLVAIQHPAFLAGEIFPLNSANIENPAYGRLDGETDSGYWLYAYLRANPKTGHAVLVVVNLHPSETLRGVKIQIPAEIQERAGLRHARINGKCLIDPEASVRSESAALSGEGLPMPDLAPASAWIFDVDGK